MSHLFKPKRVFISAHPGDIALSAFGSLINGPLGSKDAVLVTVFDRSEDENLSLQPLEDRIFSVAYGCDFLALGFMDSKVRSSPEDIQEANLPKEDPIFESVRDAIRTAIASHLGSSAIYIPLGISGNIDHCIVRDAVVDIISKRPSRTEENLLFFYEEIPSTLYPKEHAIIEHARLLLGTNAARRLVDIHRWDDKRDAINIYASRSGEETISSLMHYAKSLGVAGGMAEGVWFMNKIREPSHLVDILAWVSWEAARFLGGYTTLVSNLTGSPVYQTHVKKTILIGPLYMPVDCDAYDPLETPQSIAKRLNCITLYSPYQRAEDNMVHISLSNAFREIEKRHDIEIYYLRDKETNSHVVERLLINFSACITPSRTYSRTLPAFLESLQEKMGLNFIYEPIWRHSTIWNAIYAAKCWTGINPSDNIIENFRRKLLCDTGLQSYNHTDNNSLYGALLAEPATETLQAILGQNQTCVFIAQDTLSLPMAYNISMVRNRERKLKMKTIYYTGDIDPIRNLIDGYVLPVTQQNSVGGFNWEGPIRRVITKSIKMSHSLEKRHLLDIPALSHIETHGNLRLIRQGWKLDKVAAISDNVVDELRFVDPGFSKLDNIPICYPGILMLPCTINSKERARRLVLSYASAEWRYSLDPETTLIAVHIARAVRAKAFPRDISVIKALGQCLRAEGMGILLIIVTAWKGRGGQLVSDLLSASEEMNTPESNVRLKVVNEFHWPDQTESGSSPTCFSRQDLHMATDISLGLSTYDTFAISPLEPVSCGAICMISTGCGCARRLQKLKGIESNILIADYGKQLDEILDVNDKFESIFEITNLQKKSLEEQATKEFAVELAEKVPRNTAQRTDSLARGIMIGKQMKWENEIAHSFIPILKELVCPNQ